jgi:hypothetical protein
VERVYANTQFIDTKSRKGTHAVHGVDSCNSREGGFCGAGVLRPCLQGRKALAVDGGGMAQRTVKGMWDTPNEL